VDSQFGGAVVTAEPHRLEKVQVFDMKLADSLMKQHLPQLPITAENSLSEQ